MLQYVLNVTPDLPNVFEKVGSIKYMQIPIADHWSQNLASHFPSAIEFIGKYHSLLLLFYTVLKVKTQRSRPPCCSLYFPKAT